MFNTGMQLPEFDVEGTLKEVDEKFKPLLEQAEEMAAFSKKRAAEIQEEIKQIDAEMVRSALCLTLKLHLSPITKYISQS